MTFCYILPIYYLNEFIILGTRGELLKTRLLVSSTYGTKVLNNEDQLSTIFDHWKNHLNVEYVMVTEDLINDGNHNFHSIFSIYIQKKCQMTEFRTAHCDLTEKKIKISIFLQE